MDGEKSVEGFLRRLGIDPPAPTLQADSAAPTVRAKIGRHVITGRLGAGGMGEVLRAEDPALGRSVAVKLIRGRPDTPQLARFVREARITGRLEHPGIVPVHEALD